MFHQVGDTKHKWRLRFTPWPRIMKVTFRCTKIHEYCDRPTHAGHCADPYYSYEWEEVT